MSICEELGGYLYSGTLLHKVEHVLAAALKTGRKTNATTFGGADEFLARESVWPAPGSEDTELGVLMGPEVRHGEAEVHARVQA